MINNNPFLSYNFITIWCKHFNKNIKTVCFDFIDVEFYKTKVLPLYINIGKNLTKGISYTLNLKNDVEQLKKEVLLVYDVPKYFKTGQGDLPKGIKQIKVEQYPGYITNLDNYTNYDDFITKNFSKKSKYKFRSYKRTLENAFDISYKHAYGEISKDEYNTIFDQFFTILSKRFKDKSETNNNLDTDEWAFYKELVYPLILEKKASLFVIYETDKPIAISLNYFSEHILFFAITGFDIDYSKYNVGTVHLMALFEWCFDQNIKTFDFSKGFYDYKARWGDLEYRFENHIFYNSKSIYSTFIAHSLASFFRLKQFLRDKNINEKLHKLSFILKRH